jgi:hypothetical protein
MLRSKSASVMPNACSQIQVDGLCSEYSLVRERILWSSAVVHVTYQPNQLHPLPVSPGNGHPGPVFGGPGTSCASASIAAFFDFFLPGSLRVTTGTQHKKP